MPLAAPLSSDDIPPRKGCPLTPTKNRFETKQGADYYISARQNQSGYRKNELSRVKFKGVKSYYCRGCRGFHITSKKRN